MLKQSLNLKLSQKLSPQQIQLMKLLQVPTMELEQRVKEELEDNPALEEGQEEREKTEDGDNELEEENDSRDDFDIDQYMSDDETPSYKLSVAAVIDAIPLNPFNLFFLRTILIIPEVPSGSYFAEGFVTTSILSIAFAGNASNTFAPSFPTRVLGRPSIKIVTLASPRRLIFPS